MEVVPAKIHVNVTKPAHTISRHLYGHFLEHIGWGIYGGVYVDPASRLPNKNGLRLDVIDALRGLNIPNLRWPGGCFADTYHWKDGIGPKQDRPSVVNTWWGKNTENNHFGTHDFLELCEALDAEPFITANVGSGTVRELQEWLQYVNFEGESPMSNLRRRNGREKPWLVKYWGLGNEAWGCGGNMRAEYYADIYRQYATFISDWTNSDQLFRIASGPRSDDYHWMEVLMRNVPHSLIEGVGLHHYSVIDWNDRGPSRDFTEEQYFKTMKAAFAMDGIVTRHKQIMDEFDPEKKVALVVDEWGGWYAPEPGTNPGFLYQQNTMRDALIAAVTLNTLNSHCDRVRMANLAQMVNVLQCVLFVKDEVVVKTPTYHVMEMLCSHQDAKIYPVKVSSPLYRYDGETLPALSVSASGKENGNLFISLANVDPVSHYEVEIHGIPSCKEIARVLRGAAVQNGNTFDKPDLVQPRTFETEKRDGVIHFPIPAASIVTLNLDVAI